MKLFTAPIIALALLGTQVHAENLNLRFAYSQAQYTPVIKVIRAESGNFGLKPSLPEHAQGAQWRVVAKNSEGAVVYESTVRNGQQWIAESFNPSTGRIEHSQTIRNNEGVFEVSVPFDANVASVEVLPPVAKTVQTAQSAAGNPSPIGRVSRAAIVDILKASKPAMASALATSATTIIESGPSSTRMDYVFIGDGYTAAEMGKWEADAQKVINGFMADPLFAANRASINVHRVDIVSNQSGADELDNNIYKDTALDGEFNCYNIARLLCVNTNKVFDAVGSVLAPDARDVIIVVSNSVRYGGSGGQVATLSMHADAIEVALHEIGHTAFALADEYDYGTCYADSEPTEGDVSKVGTRSVKWGDLIKSTTNVPTKVGAYPNGTVGTFVGAQYCATEKYRPTENSRMRTLGFPWHAVNERLMNKVFAQYNPTCTERVDTNTNHVNAGRAYTTTSGTWIKTTTWYAKGSNTSLGTAGSTSNKLAETSPGYFIKGSCPAAPTAPAINTTTTPAVRVVSSDATNVNFEVSVTGTASDVNGDLDVVRFAISTATVNCAGAASFTCIIPITIAKSSLPAVYSNGQVSALDKTGLNVVKTLPNITFANAPLACYKATNSAHKTAGRATSQTTAFTTTFYAKGTNDNLGTSGLLSTSVQETAAGSGSWRKVTACP